MLNLLESGETILAKLHGQVEDADLEALIAERQASFAKVVTSAPPGMRAVIFEQEGRIQAALGRIRRG